jgi:hypothetical protein
LGKLANQTAAGSLKGEKIDEIIDFAGIREFIDMSVQSYSSGMTVRLVRKQNAKGARILSRLSIAISMLIS